MQENPQPKEGNLMSFLPPTGSLLKSFVSIKTFHGFSKNNTAIRGGIPNGIFMYNVST